MVEKKVVQVGKKLKDFKLKDHNGKDFVLADCKGKKVLLSFHPLAWTPVCAQQMKSLEKNRKALDKLNAVAVGLSIDTVPCQAAWARSLKIKNTRLLSDFWPHGGFAKSLGILRPDGISERANIIVDEAGKVIFIKVYPIRQLPDMKEILAALKG
ncbi:MAG: redoxin domain-containing protein [Deltaproteobacteria bacterium]|nr:redoxin domain-containing protein [Deltaproteobacteria bacterium]